MPSVIVSKSDDDDDVDDVDESVLLSVVPLVVDVVFVVVSAPLHEAVNLAPSVPVGTISVVAAPPKPGRRSVMVSPAWRPMTRKVTPRVSSVVAPAVGGL
jgi:hypothetical protein